MATILFIVFLIFCFAVGALIGFFAWRDRNKARLQAEAESLARHLRVKEGELRFGTLRSVPRPPQGSREKAERLRQLQLLTQPPAIRSTDARLRAASVSSPLKSPPKSPLVLPGVVTETQATSPDAARALEAPESLAGVSSLSSPSPTTENATTGLETQNTGGMDFSSYSVS